MKKRIATAGSTVLLHCLLASCGHTADSGGLNLREAVLPNGQKIQCEVMIRSEDMARGMMFRDSLEADRGMLFHHAAAGQYPYWMFQCKIALDIIWMDQNKRIVEMSPNTPPCTGAAETCPSYGGHAVARTVLEMQAGSIARHGLKVGDRIEF
ncbi:MAG: DUF192 domain-containing protein [Acidobacteriia bacterium]|nr:DUF192 domain-containing protein [Terriglobia bacterium]